MKIAYRDFPRITNQGIFGINSSEITLDEVVANANRWIAENNVNILNIESLIASDRFTASPDLDGYGIRVWYIE